MNRTRLKTPPTEQNNFKPFYFLATSTILFLMLLNVIASASLVAHGADIKKIELDKAKLEAENWDIEHQILAHESLLTLKQKAEAEGYLKPSRIITLPASTVTVALNP
jgi:hypothetical protein